MSIHTIQVDNVVGVGADRVKEFPDTFLFVLREYAHAISGTVFQVLIFDIEFIVAHISVIPCRRESFVNDKRNESRAGREEGGEALELSFRGNGEGEFGCRDC